MLEELGRVRDGWPGPLVLGGDFNEILHAFVRSTVVCPGNAMAGFRIFINQRALLDLPLRGGEFTWSRSGVDAVASRLDRFLVSIDWEELFPESVQRRMGGRSLIIFLFIWNPCSLRGERPLLDSRICGLSLMAFLTLSKSGGRLGGDSSRWFC